MQWSAIKWDQKCLVHTLHGHRQSHHTCTHFSMCQVDAKTRDPPNPHGETVFFPTQKQIHTQTYIQIYITLQYITLQIILYITLHYKHKHAHTHTQELASPQPLWWRWQRHNLGVDTLWSNGASNGWPRCFCYFPKWIRYKTTVKIELTRQVHPVPKICCITKSFTPLTPTKVKKNTEQQRTNHNPFFVCDILQHWGPLFGFLPAWESPPMV